MRFRIFAACTLLTLFSCAGGSDRFTYSGTLQTDSARVGSMAGGRITAVLVSDGDRVRSGQILVRLDDRQQRAALDVAVAQQSQASGALNDLLAGPRPADIDKAAAAAAQAQASYLRVQLAEPAQVASATQAAGAAQAEARASHAALANALRDYARARKLYSEGAISSQAMDGVRATAQQAAGTAASADARLRTAEAQLATVSSGTTREDVTAAARAADAAEANLALVRAGARPDQVAQARAAWSAAVSSVSAAKARLDECLVRSPADGMVDGIDLHPGDLVAAGSPVATIDESGDPWVRIYVSQSDLGRVKIGAATDVRSDSIRSTTFGGRVESIDASAQFAPRNVQTASDRADLAFGVKVRVRDKDHVLRAGTTVEVALP